MANETLGNYELYVRNVQDGLVELKPKSVQCCLTSPPYWRKRDYGFPGQLGLEETVEEYVANLVDVFRHVRRVLRDDGTLWLNLGDSHVDDSKWGGYTGSTHPKGPHGATAIGRSRVFSGIVAGNLAGVPFRVALALQADGWILRQCIIWHKLNGLTESLFGKRWIKCRIKVANSKRTKDPKKNAFPKGEHGARAGADFNSKAQWKPCPGCAKCLPNDGYVLKSGSGRPTTMHEYLFLFSKGQKYFYDGDSSKEPASGTAHSRGHGRNPKAGQQQNVRRRDNNAFSEAVSGLVENRNWRSVLSLVSEPSPVKHFAAFPSELVRRVLLAGTSRGGCCSQCGSSYAPIVVEDRKPTRPAEKPLGPKNGTPADSPYWDHSGTVIGNRDPRRESTTTRVVGFKACCQCRAPMARNLVLDCFAGTCRTGQVARHMHCDFVGYEGSEEYAEIGRIRLQEPWLPLSERKKKKKQRQKKGTSQ